MSIKKLTTTIIIIFAISIAFAGLYWWKLIADAKIKEMEEARIEFKQKEDLRQKREHEKEITTLLENKIVSECLAIENNKDEKDFCNCKAYTITFNTHFSDLEKYYNLSDEKKKVIWQSLIENNEELQKKIRGCANLYSDKYIENITEDMLKKTKIKETEKEKIKDTLKDCIRKKLEDVNSELDYGVMFLKCMIISSFQK